MTTEIDVADFIESLVEDIDREMSGDLGGCAYYLRYMKVEGFEDGTCSFGCREEPECVTCEPEGGWPSHRPDFDYRKEWAKAFAEYLLANATVTIDLGAG